MDNQFAIQLFEQQQVRIVWDAEVEKYYFSIVDVVQILTDSADGRKYWNKLKQRLKAEGNESVTNCHQLKFIRTNNSNLFLQMYNFVYPLPQFGTGAHYLCAKFYYTMSHHTTQFYNSIPPIFHFGVSRGFDFLLMTPGGTA